MRTITLIIVHCSAVRPDQTSSAAQIDTWHRKDNHWKLGIGYHYVVRRDGEIESGRPEWMVGAHCLNHNAHSIDVCYEGGLQPIILSSCKGSRCCGEITYVLERFKVVFAYDLEIIRIFAPKTNCQ
jgi:hypothetical protein